MKDDPLSEDDGRPPGQTATIEMRIGISKSLNTASKFFKIDQLTRPCFASQRSQFDIPLHWTAHTPLSLIQESNAPLQHQQKQKQNQKKINFYEQQNPLSAKYTRTRQTPAKYELQFEDRRTRPERRISPIPVRVQIPC